MFLGTLNMGYGRHALLDGRYYRPQHAILAEIHRARHSIKLSLFLIGNLLGEHGDSVIDALIHARNRGVHVHILLNGHLARQGSVGKAEREIGVIGVFWVKYSRSRTTGL